MMSLLSAEGYKLIRSKSFYICIAVVIGVVALLYGMLDLADRIDRGEFENGTAGVVVSEQAEEGGTSTWEEISLMEIVGQIFSGDFLPCVLAVFVSIFVIGEYASGMMKNVAGKGRERWKIFLSKLIVTELAVIPIVLIGLAATLLGGLVFKGSSSFTGDFWKNLTVFVGLQLLLEMAFAAVCMLTSDLVRNYAAGISLGIGIAAFPVILMEGLVDRLFYNSGFTPSAYWVVTRSIHCPYEGFTAGYIMETIFVAGGWLLLAAGLGIWHFSRADIA